MTFRWNIIALTLLVMLTISCVEINRDHAPPAPYKVYIKAGNNLTFKYWGHEFSIDYISDNPHIIVVRMDNVTIKEIKKNVTDVTGGIYWNYNNFHFEIVPIIRKKNPAGELVPYQVSSWNTSEIYFMVTVLNVSKHMQ